MRTSSFLTSSALKQSFIPFVNEVPGFRLNSTYSFATRSEQRETSCSYRDRNSSLLSWFPHHVHDLETVHCDDTCKNLDGDLVCEWSTDLYWLTGNQHWRALAGGTYTSTRGSWRAFWTTVPSLSPSGTGTVWWNPNGPHRSLSTSTPCPRSWILFETLGIELLQFQISQRT